MTEKPDIEYLAKLARMELTDKEKKALENDLDAIIGYMDTLAAIDTEGVEPLEHVLGLSNVMREDKLSPSSPREEILGCAPHTQDGFYKVPIAVQT